MYLDIRNRVSNHSHGIKLPEGQSLEETVQHIAPRFSFYFVKSMKICNGDFRLLPDLFYTAMIEKCPRQYQNGKGNEFVVYVRGFRYPLWEWINTLNNLRQKAGMTKDDVDCSCLIGPLSLFIQNAEESGCPQDMILPWEYIGKAQNIIQRNKQWNSCIKKKKGLHGMLEYLIKWLGIPTHHVHIVGTFVNDPQSFNAEAVAAMICEGTNEDGTPRTEFSKYDATSLNVLPCGHFGYVRSKNRAAVEENLKYRAAVRVNLKDWKETNDDQSMVKFKPGAAMTTDEVRLRLKEVDEITPEQFNSPDLTIRVAEETDFSARTKGELQQQILHQSKHGVLGRWVLQDDGSRVLELVRCSGIEGHHKDTRSSWAHPDNRMGNCPLNVGGTVIYYVSLLLIVLFILLII